MKMKKFLSVLAVVSVLATTVSGLLGVSVYAENIVSSDSDGVFWIEESDCDTSVEMSTLTGRVGTNGTAAANTTDLASGGDAYWAWWSGATCSATYKVNAQSAGTYKLWYRGSDPTNTYYNTVKLKVNGNDITSSLSKVTGTDFTIKVDPSGTQKNYACAFFAAEVTLTSGENTLLYEVTEKSSTGQKYACLLDCIVIAPASYEWESPSVSTKPAGLTSNVISADSDGVFWIEESNYDDYSNASDGVLSTRVGTNGTVASKTTDLVSGGDAYWAWWSGATYSATYKINAEKAGTYKIWYRGSDPTNSYYDTAKLKLNGSDITSSLSKVNGTNFTVEVDSTGTKKTFACAFFVDEVALVSGENTITYEILTKSTGGSRYAGLFDCVVIAPSDYEWETPSISTKPATAVSSTISADSDGVFWIEESDYDTYSNASDGVLSTRVGTSGTVAAETTDLVSGGDAYWAWWSGVTYSATYKINAEEAGTYKIWYRGSDPTNEYCDTVKLKVNDTDITASLSKVAETGFTVKVDPTGTKKTFACAFFTAEVTLVSGENTITYEILTKSTKGRYAGLFDCMVIAPSNYEWESPSVSTKPEEKIVIHPEFVLDGDVDTGDSAINASIYFNKKSDDRSAKVLCVLYDSDNGVKAVSQSEKAFSEENNRLDITMLLQDPVHDGDKVKVFIWDNENDMLPLSPVLVLGEKISLTQFFGEVNFHTELMEEYLNDSYDSIELYADGKSELDRPNPITFSWSWVGMEDEPSEYTLSVSENSDMSNPITFTTEEKSYSVYNFKINTQYYWTVSAEGSDGNVIVSNVATLKTANRTPRNLKVNGIKNVRDIGGWNTADGKQVKQGLLYRSMAFTYMSDGVFKQYITAGGINTMKNELGIKSEIDIRRDSEMPIETYTESVLGEGVNYFRNPMNYDGDYLESNKDTLQSIFAELSNSANYPIVYHCAAGADRTAVVTYLVNGLLGVSQEDLFRDYLITNFARTDNKFRPISTITSKYVATIDAYRGDTLSEKIYNYLNEVVEVPTEQLNFIIAFLK